MERFGVKNSAPGLLVNIALGAPWLVRLQAAAIVGTLALGATVSAHGQGAAAAQPSSVTAPQADSAQQARSAYRRAVSAYRQKDIPAARREMAQAAAWWPTQQAYLEASASLAAVAHDTADATHWISRLADLGIGGTAAGDSSFRAFAGDPAFDAAARRLRAAVAPDARSHVRLTVADSMLHPEGVTFDSRTRRWFVGSVRERRVVAIGSDRSTRDFVSPGADGVGGVFGMAVDAARRTLWLATTSLPRMNGFTAGDSGRVGVYGYDLDRGTLKRKAWATRDSSTAHTFGDVVVAPNGDVYVSDSQAPWIYKLALGSDSLVRWATHPLFRSLQGMTVTPDGTTMYVADYSHGLLRIDIATRSVLLLASSPNVTTLGVDGLYLREGNLIGVQNGVTPARVVRFCLDAPANRVRSVELLDRNTAVADEPTLGVIVGDSLFYVATSQWDKFDDAGQRVVQTTLRPATVLGLSLETKGACQR